MQEEEQQEIAHLLKSSSIDTAPGSPDCLDVHVFLCFCFVCFLSTAGLGSGYENGCVWRSRKSILANPIIIVQLAQDSESVLEMFARHTVIGQLRIQLVWLSSDLRLCCFSLSFSCGSPYFAGLSGFACPRCGGGDDDDLFGGGGGLTASENEDDEGFIGFPSIPDPLLLSMMMATAGRGRGRVRDRDSVGHVQSQWKRRSILGSKRRTKARKEFLSLSVRVCPSLSFSSPVWNASNPAS